MDTHVLLNFMERVGENDKMIALLSILSRFCNEFKSIIQKKEC